MTLVRMGECNQCGYCCEVIAHAELDFSGNSLEWMQARGIPSSGIKMLPIIDPCPSLGVNNNCRIYPDRPQQCKDFPQTPEEIEGTPCSYYFVEVESNTA